MLSLLGSNFCIYFINICFKEKDNVKNRTKILTMTKDVF